MPVGSTVIGLKARGPAQCFQGPAVPSVLATALGKVPGPFPPVTHSSKNKALFSAEKGPPSCCLRVRGREHTSVYVRCLLLNWESFLMIKKLSF